MQNTVEITLISNTPAGNKPKRFSAQSSGRLPSTIRWFGGTTRDLQGFTDVRIVDGRGGVLIDGQLNTHFRVTREVDGWVIFDVLKPE
jgi:hypothetical protein